METLKKLESPFKTQREAHPDIYCRIFGAINDKRLLDHKHKTLLLAILSFTTNEELFRAFDKLDVPVLEDLARLSETALESLRNWGGRSVTAASTPSTPPRNPQHDLGLIVLKHLRLKDAFPGIPGASFSRSARFGRYCNLRQQNLCILTGLRLDGSQETAHIFPHSILNPNNSVSLLTWRFIQIFLGTEITKTLVRELWSEEDGIQTAKNGIATYPHIHNFFDKGKISLIPIYLTRGIYDYLDVEVGIYSSEQGPQSICTWDKLSIGEQYTCGDDNLPYRVLETHPRYIKNGDIIRITTPHSISLPLPSPVLLYWHRHLWSTLTSAGLGSSQSESKAEDLKSFLALNNFGEGSSGHRRQGYDGACDQDWSDDEVIGEIREREARFIAFLEKITVPEDFVDDYDGNNSDDYYYP
ncbi:hypothetical protein TWF718_007313 [Orbilia javanica]|uniref:HNH nuclease domain-containing protein n=1 Tax=Orbilia javanica TaxID=47235 RepID=A0AAN8NVY7_9PEZI